MVENTEEILQDNVECQDMHNSEAEVKDDEKGECTHCNCENKSQEESKSCCKSVDDAKDKKSKKQKGDKKLEALESKNAELEDRVKRQMAEFENFRKRTEKEKSTMFEMGAKSVIEKILPVVDNFERGLNSITEEQRGPVYEGMNMIYKQLLEELSKLEVKPIECVGEEFNPDFHNAVMQVETEEFESGFVAQELLKGYTYRGVVVRHSMVGVAQ